jgi:hypothetical protein
MKVLKYEVRFESENKYGVISKTTHNRKEAYRLYHKIKEEMEFRLGTVFVVEHYVDGSTGRLCTYHTGQQYDALKILDEMISMNKQLTKIYNQQFLSEKRSELDKLQNNIQHALEMIDYSKVGDEEKFNEYVMDKMKNLRLIRREIKNREDLASRVCGKLINMKNELTSAKAIIKNRELGALKDTSNDPANLEKRRAYLASIGLDMGEYDRAIDTLPADIDLTPVVLYKKNK